MVSSIINEYGKAKTNTYDGTFKLFSINEGLKTLLGSKMLQNIQFHELEH